VGGCSLWGVGRVLLIASWRSAEAASRQCIVEIKSAASCPNCWLFSPVACLCTPADIQTACRFHRCVPSASCTG